MATYTGFFLFGLYRGLWRYTGVEDLLRIAKAVVCSTFLSMAGMVLLYRFDGYSRIVMIVYGFLLFFGVAATRLSFRVFASLIHGPRKEKVPVLIYGAGDGGEVVLRECRKNAQVEYQPVGFLDDDPCKQGRTVAGLRILGGADKLPEILRHERVARLHYLVAENPGQWARRTDSHGLRGTGTVDQAAALDFVEEGAGS